ncbi:MAG: hypothetical protein ACW974_09075, partial [Candidatus Thorarchaeota archaeon]
MVMRIKRTVDIAMSNYEGIIGSSVFSYEGRVAYATDNMQLDVHDLHAIFSAWNDGSTNFSVKHISFMTAMAETNGFVAINPEGAISLIVGTGKGVWFVSCFASMDQDKSGILRECVQAAKLLETSVSVLDV